MRQVDLMMIRQECRVRVDAIEHRRIDTNHADKRRPETPVHPRPCAKRRTRARSHGKTSEGREPSRRDVGPGKRKHVAQESRKQHAMCCTGRPLNMSLRAWFGSLGLDVALAYEALGRTHIALEYIQQVLESPEGKMDQRPTTHAQGYALRGRLHAAHGDFAAAEAAFDANAAPPTAERGEQLARLRPDESRARARGRLSSMHSHTHTRLRVDYSSLLRIRSNSHAPH